jgi:Tfp pilus assembly protein FimT
MGMMISILAALALAAAPCAWGDSSKIADKASAIEAAKRYTRGRCTSQAPCTFRAEREGRQWRVWVHLSRRDPQRGAAPDSERYVILFFDSDGNLIRRVEGQ